MACRQPGETDGQLIGYVDFGKDPKNFHYNFWSIKPDGSDNRLEFQTPWDLRITHVIPLTGLLTVNRLPGYDHFPMDTRN